MVRQPQVAGFLDIPGQVLASLSTGDVPFVDVSCQSVQRSLEVDPRGGGEIAYKA